MKIWTVDAFSHRAFRGNPAGVVIVDTFPEPIVMQSIAMEMAISETTFVVLHADDHFSIRWFTPMDEAPLCAHATLSAAHILWEQGFTNATTLRFESAAGPLTVYRRERWIMMDFPKQVPIMCQDPPPLLRHAMGTIIDGAQYYHFPDHYLVVLPTEKAVLDVVPDMQCIKQIPCRAVTVTAPAQAPYDFVSRYFAPRVGIPEDPVCGSSHCRLAPLWADKMGKTEFLAYTGSSRGGEVCVHVQGERVHIGGEAITVLEGRINI